MSETGYPVLFVEQDIPDRFWSGSRLVNCHFYLALISDQAVELRDHPNSGHTGSRLIVGLCKAQQVPGHQIQVDVKFLTFIGRRVRRSGVTSTRQLMMQPASGRSRSMRGIPQAKAIDFIDYVIASSPSASAR
jgi:hypothetical protein